jgi:hypothetical protein
VVLLPTRLALHTRVKQNGCSTRQRCFCYDATKSVTIVQGRYRTRFGKDAPSKNSIKEWHRKLSQDGHVCKKGGQGCPRSSDRSTYRGREGFSRSPQKSICQASQQLQAPPTTVWRVVKKLLLMASYRRPLLQALSNSAKEDRSTSCVNFLDTISDDESLMS